MGPPVLRNRKRRAARACASCNARKIRCDGAETGYPCTGCRSEGYECFIPERRKRRKAADKKSPSRPHANLTAEDDGHPSPQIHAAGSRALPQATSTEDLPRDASASADSLLDTTESPKPPLTQHTILHQVPHYPFLINFAHIPTNAQVGFQLPELPTSPHLANTHNVTFQDSERKVQDLRFLKQKGALDLPERKVMDEFVSHYFQFVHPFFPIIEKMTFLESYHRAGPAVPQSFSGPSLLLLQAVLFSASSVSHFQETSQFTLTHGTAGNSS